MLEREGAQRLEVVVGEGEAAGEVSKQSTRQSGFVPQAASHAELVRQCALDPNREAARRRIAELTTELLRTTGKGLQLPDAELSSLDLSGFDLRGANLNRARLYGTDCSSCDLSLASLVCAGMERTNLTRASLRGAYVHALAAQVCSFRNADLTGLVDATGSLFHGCNMSAVKLSASVLSGATFYQCDLEDADLEGANLQGGTINECLLSRARFECALVSQLTITKCHMNATSLARSCGEGLVIQRPTACDGLVLAQASLASLRLQGLSCTGLMAADLHAPVGDFVDCALLSANFRNATLSGSRWTSCNVPAIDLALAKLEQASWRSCNMAGAILDGCLCENMHVVECQLQGARMAKLVARCLTVRDTPLDGADLREAYLYRAMLTADPPRALSLRGADLSSANLVQAYVAGDLRNANLRNANLTYGRFNQSDMSGADLSGCATFQSSLIKVNFTGATLAGLRAPVFADRCSGLQEGLGAAADSAELAWFVGELQCLMATARSGST